IGWIPYFLDRMDWTYTRHHQWTGQDFGKKLPSQVFAEHVVTCFIDDPSGMELRDRVGIDNICWEADYPHSDSTWPVSPETLAPSLAGVPADEVAKITYENALRHYRFDPFAHRPKEQCTVGALRAGAADVDVTPKPAAGLRSDRVRHTRATDLLQPGIAGRR
ncbi:MAG TPA: amidohydrolase family protein, partial [Acidimicrobiales bacterium]|nr:amidohydrolase family protein [Acidimicrobiales bacterium]